MGKVNKPKKVKTADGVTRYRDKHGRWKKGVSGNKLGKPEKIKGDLASMIAEYTSVRRLARSLVRAAYNGDERSVLKVTEILERVRAEEAPMVEANFDHLSVHELSLLTALLSKVRGGLVSDSELLEPARKIVAELAPAVEEESESESDRVSEDDESEEESEVAAADNDQPTEIEVAPAIPEDPSLKSVQERQRRELEQKQWDGLYGKDGDLLGVVSLRKPYRGLN